MTNSLSTSCKSARDSRIDAVFSELGSHGKKGFIAYITGGDPSIEKTVEIILALEKAGVDILELGIPFSDPSADGPTIQAASQRALAHGASVKKILEVISRVRRQSSIPIVLFTYLNPIYSYGFQNFLTDAVSAGADGLLILDLPPHEIRFQKELAIESKLQMIQLIAPTTPEDRIESIVQAAQGFVYCISYEGVTGVKQTQLSQTLSTQIERIRRYTSLPIAVGFGISTPTDVKAAASQADAIVVGTALVRCIAQHSSSPDFLEKIQEFVLPLIKATRD